MLFRLKKMTKIKILNLNIIETGRVQSFTHGKNEDTIITVQVKQLESAYVITVVLHGSNAHSTDERKKQRDEDAHPAAVLQQGHNVLLALTHLVLLLRPELLKRLQVT